MKKKYFLTLLLSLTLFITQKSWACDLLAIDIGSDKSTIENIFGTIDEESTDNTSSQGELVGTLKSGVSKVTGPVSVYIAEKNSFRMKPELSRHYLPRTCGAPTSRTHVATFQPKDRYYQNYYTVLRFGSL